MCRAVVVLVAFDLLGEDFDLARFGTERIDDRVATEVTQIVVATSILIDREENVAAGPELFKRWHFQAVHTGFLGSVLIKATDPAHFVQTFGELFFKSHLLGEFAIDPEVGMRFVLGFNRLLHGNITKVRV